MPLLAAVLAALSSLATVTAALIRILSPTNYKNLAVTLLLHGLSTMATTDGR